jgi:hypothetical protein
LGIKSSRDESKNRAEQCSLEHAASNRPSPHGWLGEHTEDSANRDYPPQEGQRSGGGNAKDFLCNVAKRPTWRFD